RLLDMAIDPVDPKSIWVTLAGSYDAPGGGFIDTVDVAHSSDGAKTFTVVTSVPSPKALGPYRAKGGLVVTRASRRARATIAVWATFDKGNTGTAGNTTPAEKLGWVYVSTSGGSSWRQWDTSQFNQLTGIA